MKLLTVIGARPQFIKAAAVSREIKVRPRIREIIVHTGQHYDYNMSEIFFKQMEIPEPHYNMDIHGLGHGAMTGRMLEKLEEVIVKEKPDLVMVYGDTNSTLAGALAAAKLHVPVAHVEAGLRSFNMRMPEEINRILADRISTYLFCPTENAVENLKREGFGGFGCTVLNTGDVMQDAALHYAKAAGEFSSIIKELGLDRFILCTIHRAENTDDPAVLKGIFQALETINGEVPVVIPLHPRTRKFLGESGINTSVRMFDPVGYFDMIELLRHCGLVMTDSGGLQKEAYFFRKHCVTLRNETEWVELVENGFNVVSGTSTEEIYRCYRSMIGKKSNFDLDLYGGGKASKKIVDVLNSLS